MISVLRHWGERGMYKNNINNINIRGGIGRSVVGLVASSEPLWNWNWNWNWNWKTLPFSVPAGSHHRSLRLRRASMAAASSSWSFELSPSSLLKIAKGDITRWSIDSSSDAIVNPANERMLGGGGADGAIHRGAGPELVEACRKVPEVRPGVRCPTGQARITPGFKLPASHVIHTVGPVYHSDPDPPASLSNAYSNSLALAKQHGIRYIAFPAISCGVFGYPYDEAASVAISTVKEYANDFKEVHFVLFSDEIFDVWYKKAKELLQS